MPYIKIVKTKENIDYLSRNMNIYQAINNLNYILKHKCKDCNEQCSDCYIDYIDKISIEKLLTYFKNNKKIIKGAKTL